MRMVCVLICIFVLFLPSGQTFGCDDLILNSFLSNTTDPTYVPLANQLEGDIAFMRGIKHLVDSSKPALYGHVYRAFQQQENGCFDDLIDLIPAGYVKAIELGALLYQLSHGGGDAEDLAAALGTAISKQPTLILALITKYKLFEPSKGALIAGMLPVSVYVDKPSESIAELLKRKKAILTVTDPALLQAKTACLKTVNQYINDFERSLTTTR